MELMKEQALSYENTIAQRTSEVKTLREELSISNESMQKTIDNQSKHNQELQAEIDRLQGLFDESQRLLADRDVSLTEALKNVEDLKAMEKQLQIDLAKSEHMRLHHEGNHSSALNDMSDLEKELQRLREGS